MDNTHYHVLIGLQGCYMPDSNYPCETYQQARDLAAYFLLQEREDGIEVATVLRGYLWAVGEYNQIEITEGCRHPECMEDLD